MKECFSSGSYLYQKHLLYRGTTNNEVTSEQNINSTAADPRGTQREGNKTLQKLTQRQVNTPIKRSAEENMSFPWALQHFITPRPNHSVRICVLAEGGVQEKGDKMRRFLGKKTTKKHEGIDEDRHTQTGEKERQRDGDVKIESGPKNGEAQPGQRWRDSSANKGPECERKRLFCGVQRGCQSKRDRDPTEYLFSK